MTKPSTPSTGFSVGWEDECGIKYHICLTQLTNENLLGETVPLLASVTMFFKVANGDLLFPSELSIFWLSISDLSLIHSETIGSLSLSPLFGSAGHFEFKSRVWLAAQRSLTAGWRRRWHLFVVAARPSSSAGDLQLLIRMIWVLRLQSSWFPSVFIDKVDSLGRSQYSRFQSQSLHFGFLTGGRWCLWCGVIYS